MAKEFKKNPNGKVEVKQTQEIVVEYSRDEIVASIAGLDREIDALLARKEEYEEMLEVADQ